MRLIKNEEVVGIMERTMNYVDERLMNHGKRVAYLMFKVLWPLKMFDDKAMQNILILAMLHDIGAYKTEEIDKMVEFETKEVWDHSVYGYLFLRQFSPLRELAPVILFHHAKCCEISSLPPENQMLAQLISLTDRADVCFVLNGNLSGFDEHIEKSRDIDYNSQVIDMFNGADIDFDNVYRDIDSDTEFNRIFRETAMALEEVEGYIEMLVFSIDFRSSQTVIHTIAATGVSEHLAGLMDMDDDEIAKVRTGAMLHDIGKVGVPVSILESTERLDAKDMIKMRNHVKIAREILEGSVATEILNMATKHHEKLNGTGYIDGIGEESLSPAERLVAVADIFSALCGARSYKDAYPKEKIINILEDMSSDNLLDSEIVALTIEHYDALHETVKQKSAPVFKDYDFIREEFARINGRIKDGDFGELQSPVA